MFPRAAALRRMKTVATGLLVALAAPRRPAAIAAHAGELAGPFFDALFAEIGQDALIGVASVYLR